MFSGAVTGNIVDMRFISKSLTMGNITGFSADFVVQSGFYVSSVFGGLYVYNNSMKQYTFAKFDEINVQVPDVITGQRAIMEIENLYWNSTAGFVGINHTTWVE